MATFEVANIVRSLLTPELIETTIQKYTNFKKFRKRILTPAITLYLFLFTSLDNLYLTGFTAFVMLCDASHRGAQSAHIMALRALIRDSLDSVIHEFNDYIKLFMPTEEPITASKQAWATARGRIPYAFLREVFQLIVQIFCNKFHSVIHWKGFRVLAADGTRIRLTKDRKLKNIFGGAKNKHDNYPPQATLVCLVSVFTGVCIDFVVGVYKAAEVTLTNILLQHLGPKDLVLLESPKATYFNFGLMASMLSRGLQFIVRARSNFRMNIIKRIGLNDWICRIKVSEEMKKKFLGIPETFQARVISCRRQISLRLKVLP